MVVGASFAVVICYIHFKKLTLVLDLNFFKCSAGFYDFLLAMVFLYCKGVLDDYVLYPIVGHSNFLCVACF